MATTATTPSELFEAIDSTIRNQTAVNSITPTTHSDLLYNMVQVLSADTYTTGGTYSGNTIILQRNDGQSVEISGITTDNFYVTGGTYSGNNITLSRNDGQSVEITGITSDNFYTTGSTLNGTTLSFDRTDTANAYSVDLRTLVDFSVNYSNIAFVDVVNGNDATAVLGRFDRPFAVVAVANLAVAATAPTSTTRGLVYVRKGSYGGTIQMQNYVDFYCDAGVIFTGTWQLSGADINCNVFGFASWFRNSTSARCFLILNSCNLYIEGHYVDNTGSWAEIITTNANFANIVMNFTRIRATTTSTGFGGTIRSNVNLTLNVKEYVKAEHSVFDIRTISGKIIINTPEIILGGVNIFGGNFKQAIIVYSANVGSKLIINADLRNEQLTYLGGLSAMITLHGAANADIELNGNIYAGENVGIYSNAGANTKLNYQGDIKSNLRAVVLLGSGNTLIRDSHIQHPSTATTTGLIFMNATQNVIFKNCIFRNEMVDGNIVDKSTASGNLSLIDCIATSEGVGGVFITSAEVGTVRLHNVRANKALDVNVTDLLSPTGFIHDTNIITLSL